MSGCTVSLGNLESSGSAAVSISGTTDAQSNPTSTTADDATDPGTSADAGEPPGDGNPVTTCDQDCTSGTVEDKDGDGFTDRDGDCADLNPLVNPDAREACDLLDNNCNGQLNEGADCAGKIFTLVGNGGDDFAGDGGPAIEASLPGPHALAVRSDGTIFVSEPVMHVVRRIDTQGIITTIAGNGNGLCDPVEGVQATETCISNPYGVAADEAGNVFIAAVGQNIVWRVDGDGILHRFAGTGAPMSTGDGGPAVAAGLVPLELATDAEGSLYILESSYQVRRVDLGGTIETIVAIGAVEKSNWTTGDIAIGTKGTLFVLGTRVYSKEPNGNLVKMPQLDYGRAIAATHLPYRSLMSLCQIERLEGGDRIPVVGTGLCGGAGDGGPAIEAMLGDISDLAFDKLGNLLLVESSGHRIRIVFP